MASDRAPELAKEFLDDFYAECDEHLGNIRDQLIALEGSLGQNAPSSSALEGLFRSMHSFKGISAIVGLRPAERLAHAAEDYLRALTRGQAKLSPAGLDLLREASQRLEEIVGAHRLHQPIPEADDLAAELTAFSPEDDKTAGQPRPEAEARPAAPDPVAAARARGLAAWRCTFLPSRELDQRGVNVNSVRERLAKLGEILSAAPSVRPGGAIAFDFVVGVRAAPEDLATWSADGVTFEPLAVAASSTRPVASEAAPATPAEHSSSLFIAPSHIVRVDLGRLDDLMRIAGEMVIHRSRLEDRIAQATGDTQPLREVSVALGRSLRDLRQALARVRLVPVAEIFTRMPFVVRDLAKESEKEVRLLLEGQQTEIDKYLVERLKEPLLHLVRNAFSHGVESPAERKAAGKPAEATIVLRASAVGDSVVIQVRDDGRGIDPVRVAARAAALGLPIPEPLDETALLGLLCHSGFSTRDEADRASGRGVGMAVVFNTVRELGGNLALETKAGEWTQFTLRLPLTVSILGTFIVSIGDETCAVPQSFIEEIILVEEGDVRAIRQVEVIPYRNGLLPLVRLRPVFGLDASTRTQVPALVVNTDRGRTALVVDRVQAQREVVMRPMRDPLLQVSGISGATELGDGRPVLILDPLAFTTGPVRPASADLSASAHE